MMNNALELWMGVTFVVKTEYTDKDMRVRDHCHITGKFRGSAHQECNLKFRIKPDDIKIPVIFHIPEVTIVIS